jgi:CRP/FNR family cyclic AMP-dependent transcriptional regulator
MDAGRIEALRSTAMFGAVKEDVIVFVLEHAESRHVEAGEFFFRQSDEGRSAFLLESGSVSILKEWAGESEHLRRLGVGDCFGEVALLDFGPRSASVVADTPCQALEISAPLLRLVGKSDPAQFALIYMNLGRELSRRLRDADERLFRSHVEPSASGVADGYAFAVI